MKKMDFDKLEEVDFKIEKEAFRPKILHCSTCNKKMKRTEIEIQIDEYIYSHQIVQQTGAEENLVFPNGERLWREIESFVWHMDEPVDSTSQYPQWNVMRLAQQRGVTVLLDGQGGDEILAGYYSYLPPYLSQIKQQRGLLAAIHNGWQISRIGGAPAVDRMLGDMSHRLPWRLQKHSRL